MIWAMLTISLFVGIPIIVGVADGLNQPKEGENT